MISVAPFGFVGGVDLAEQKARPLAALRRPDLPDQLHIELPANSRPRVKPGQRVLGGELLDSASGGLHAPTSGQLTGLAVRPSIRPTGGTAGTIILEPDGADRAVDPRPFADLPGSQAPKLLEHIRCAGLVGMGGGGFPTHTKLAAARAAGVHTLLLNAAECEPWVTADEALLIEHAAEVLAGLGIAARACGAARCLIGIDPRKVDAIAALERAIADRDEPALGVALHSLPARYPSGSERSLVHALTGISLPPGALLHQHGLASFNVATAYALQQAVIVGVPLTRRVVSIRGPRMPDPGDRWLRIGHPLAELVPVGHTQVWHGGSISGWQVSAEAAVGKTTTCVSLDQAEPAAAEPCIRCQRCTEVCPELLEPERLLRATLDERWEAATRDGLDDCVECGACDLVCPSRIALLASFRDAKRTIETTGHDRARAADARTRHQAHLARESARKQTHQQSRESRRARRLLPK